MPPHHALNLAEGLPAPVQDVNNLFLHTVQDDGQLAEVPT
jgi:hypothetical protein